MTTDARQQAKEIGIEMLAKACRYALWIALLQAQQLGWDDVCDALVALIRDVDALMRKAAS